MTACSPARSRFRPPISRADWGGRATRAEIDLDSVAHNTAALKNFVRPTKLMTVLKANAYGHGAAPVAHTAVEAGADWVAAYTVGECLDLRRAGIGVPCLILGPFERSEVDAILDWNLTPTIYSAKAAELLQQASRDRIVEFHLEIDTGMTRAGHFPDDAVELMRTISRFPSLQGAGLYTHFASADESDSSTTRAQFDVFQRARRRLTAEGFRFQVHHAANSAGLIAHGETHLDLARAGISTYGYYPGDVPRSVDLRPALQLASSIVRLSHVPAGTAVGYGHTFRCARESLIALVPIGYGDGLRRALGQSRGQVIIRDRFAPVVGRVSMDQISVDVTDIQGVSVGDEVVIIGSGGTVEQGADDIAERLDTISYEILSTIMPRVPRLYTRHGSVLTDET